jgi:hypothetical protein
MADEATERVEVTSGLAEGDLLLIGAARGITPGAKVRIDGNAPSGGSGAATGATEPQGS